MLSANDFELMVSRMEWEERWVELEAEGAVDLPAYAGSTIRGALGTVMRPALCGRGGECGERCESPGTCPFFGLFEQSRAAGGAGPNIPKPLVLESPLGEGLRAVALGAAVAGVGELIPPKAPGLLPMIEARGRLTVGPGERMVVGLRALGAAGAALDGMVEGLRRSGGLEVKGGRLRMAGVTAKRGLLRERIRAGAGAAAAAGRVRLALVTPTLIAGGGGRRREPDGICFDPGELGWLVAGQAVVRAVSLYNAFFRRLGEEKIPFVTPEWPGVTMTGHRLFRYRLPRHSYRQGRWMDFDGAVGWIEWEGPGVAAMMPWLRAAEVLHVGQKATFGLGRVELVG